MKPGGHKVPSIVVIQERHVRHGENFKIFKVSCKSRREYIAKFMSSRRVMYRCKSRKVRIGRGMKETTYKGSPLAISRLLLLEGLDTTFPTFDELKTMDANQAKLMEAAKSNSSSLSFFNLSDRRSEVNTINSGASLKFPQSLKSLVGSATSSRQMLDFTIEKKCTPDNLSDFRLIFGSDTNEAEDFESDEDDQEKMAVEMVLDPVTPSNSKNEEATENHKNNTIIVSLARMEKHLKQIVNAFEACQNKRSLDFLNQEPPVNVTSNSQLLRNPADSKPSLSVPPIPLAMRKSQGRSSHSHRAFDDPHPTTSATVQTPSNIQIHIPSPNNQFIFNARSLGASNTQLPFRNESVPRALCGIIEPSGSIPFFRVPGGCFLVIHATNQTTPFLHATFVTGCTNALQFQQTQLPVYGSHQIVAIHLGPYRLCNDEVNGVYAFACGTKMYSQCNVTSHFK